MIYVFDTNSFQNVFRYYPKRFPSFWEKFNDFVDSGKIISVKEVLAELERTLENRGKEVVDWLSTNKEIFRIPSAEEASFLKEIFQVVHFQQLIKTKQRLNGTPVADPFIIASAKINNGCVVTEEKEKENAGNIPAVCKHFSIRCLSLEGFMETENWTF